MNTAQYIGKMEASKYIIKKQFLDVNRYSQLIKHATNYESIFKDWLGQIILFYRITGQSANILPTGLDKNLNGFAQKLQNELYPFIQTMITINNQHLEYIGGIMRLSAYGSLQRDTDKLKQSINKLSAAQYKFQGTYRQLLSAENRLILQPTHNLQFYFQPNWIKRNNTLERYLKQLRNIEQNKPDKEILYKLSQQVEEQLLEYRKKIMNYKYGYLKQGVKLARKLLNCLAQYLSIGSQILTKINGKMKLQLSSSEGRSSNSFHQQIDHLQQFQDNYVNIAQGYRQSLKNMKNLFVYQYPIKDSKELYHSFIQYYAGNQHLLAEMFDVFNLYEVLALKRKMMADRSEMLIRRIQEQYKEKRKAVEVLNALSKRRSFDPQTVNNNSSSLNGERLRKSQQFSNQSGVENIERTIAGLLQEGLQIFKEMTNNCYKISQRYTQNRSSRNNMSISYQFKQILMKNKRPSRQELWLWRDWRDFRVFEDIKPKYDKKMIQKELAKVKKAVQQEETDEKQSCQLQGRYTGKVYLQIFPQKVKIISKRDEGINMLFPFSDIDAVEPHKKKLFLKFSGGSQVKLSNFKNSSEVQNKLNQYLMSKYSGSVSSKPSKPAIQITNQQLQAIKARMPEVQAARQKLDDPSYVKYAQGTMPGVSIQQVYDSIYSDKGSCPLDKNNSFFKYLNLKNEQKNIVETKYDKPGPYFYTGQNKQITFLNCPIFSIKKSQLDHTLPPIPFIPKSCHCTSQQKIIWISNKQLQYSSKVFSSGAKMMQTFYTVATHRIKQTDAGVHTELFNKIVFTKDTSMKSILRSGGQGQLKNLMPKMIAEMKNCMKAAIRQRGGGSGGDNNQQQSAGSQTKIGSQNPQKNASKIQINRYLILIVVGTIVINILINLIF